MSKTSNITKHQFDMATNGLVSARKIDQERQRKSIAELEKKVKSQAQQIKGMMRGYETIKQAYFEKTGEKWNAYEYAISKGWIERRQGQEEIIIG